MDRNGQSTGGFALASTGLLSGKAATTHHSSYATLATQFPDIQVKRGARFVEVGNLASAGGLSSEWVCSPPVNL
jgi:transcriptional regulator GlxA family with amidase domain